MSMPEIIFLNSKVGVTIFILVISAHIHHQKEKKPCWGYGRKKVLLKQKVKDVLI